MFASEKFRKNDYVTQSGDPYREMKPGILVDSDYEVDIMYLVDNSYIFSTNDSLPIVKEMAGYILTAWPKARQGLAYFSDFDYSPYGAPGSSLYHVKYNLNNHSANDINGWSLTNEDSYATQYSDYKNAGLDAMSRACDDSSYWRAIAAGRKRFVIMMTNNPPHDSSLELSVPHTTKALTQQACINNQVWPIWLHFYANGSQYPDYKYVPYSLGYGFTQKSYRAWSEYSDYINQSAYIPITLGAIYNGIIQ